MATELEREPVCGFCLMHGIRQVLEFVPARGYWECPLCLSKTETPDEDEEEIRAALERRRQEREPHNPPGSIIAHDHKKTIASTQRLRSGGGSKSGRRRRQPKKGTKTYAGEPTRREIEKHNARVRRRIEEGYEWS